MKLSSRMRSPVVISLGLMLFAALAGSRGFAQAPDGRPRRNPQLESITGAKNLLPNAGFECGTDGWSSLGRSEINGDLCGLYGDIQEGGAWQGKYCLRIEMGPGKTPVTYYDGSLSDPHASPRMVQSAPLVANIGWVQAEVGRPYTLSVFMKADKAGVPARMVFREGTDPLTMTPPDQASVMDLAVLNVARINNSTQAVKLSDQWERYTFTITAKEPDLCIAVGPDLSESVEDTATVWLDAVQLEAGPQATDFALREPVEAGLDTELFGNVFSNGEPIRLKVSGANASNQPGEVKVEAYLTNYFDEPLPKTSIALAVPPNGYASAYLPLETQGRGHFRAHLSWQAGGVAHKRTFPMAVVAPYTEDDSPFGVNHLPSTESQSVLYRKAGVTWARDCSFIWEQLEPREGQLSFRYPDESVGRTLAQGFNVMALLPVFPSAKWCSIDTLECFPPKDPELQVGFMTKSVQRYRDRIQYWEYLNEPLTPYTLPRAEMKIPGADYKPADYVHWLKIGYETIKKADPHCFVIGGMQARPMAYAREFIEAGGLKWVDIYSIHPYVYPHPPENLIAEMRGLLELMAGSPEGRRPIWMTEGANFGSDDKPWTPWVKPKDLTGLYGAEWERDSEKQASDYNIRQSLILLAHGVTKVVMHMAAEGEVNNGAPAMNCPWLGELGTPRKYYAAQAALADLLGPAPRAAGELVKPESVNAGNVHGYAFQCGAEAVLAAWATEGEPKQRWLLGAPAGSQVRDVVGNVKEGESVALGESPVYVTSRTLSAEDLAKGCRLAPGS